MLCCSGNGCSELAETMHYCIGILIMCPTMSFIATLLFAHAGDQIVAVWLQKLIINFPMALCWQIFFAGPFTRNVFGGVMKLISRKTGDTEEDVMEDAA